MWMTAIWNKISWTSGIPPLLQTAKNKVFLSLQTVFISYHPSVVKYKQTKTGWIIHAWQPSLGKFFFLNVRAKRRLFDRCFYLYACQSSSNALPLGTHFPLPDIWWLCIIQSHVESLRRCVRINNSSNWLNDGEYLACPVSVFGGITIWLWFRCDVFWTGCIIWEILISGRPFSCI